MLRSFEVVLTQELEVLATLKGEGRKQSTLIFFFKCGGGGGGGWGGGAANSI